MGNKRGAARPHLILKFFELEVRSLLDLCTLRDTLIADTDGVYDAREYNDRLLLVLRSMMSEAELHLLRLRMEAGKMRQIEKGTYRQVLPTGLVRLQDRQVVKHPDRLTRRAIELVFERFRFLGTVPKVLKSLRKEEVLLPRFRYEGLHNGASLGEAPQRQHLLHPLQSGVCWCLRLRSARQGPGRLGGTRQESEQADGGVDRRPSGHVSCLHRLGGVLGQPTAPQTKRLPFDPEQARRPSQGAGASWGACGLRPLWTPDERRLQRYERPGQGPPGEVTFATLSGRPMALPVACT